MGKITDKVQLSLMPTLTISMPDPEGLEPVTHSLELNHSTLRGHWEASELRLPIQDLKDSTLVQVEFKATLDSQEVNRTIFLAVKISPCHTALVTSEFKLNVHRKNKKTFSSPYSVVPGQAPTITNSNSLAYT